MRSDLQCLDAAQAVAPGVVVEDTEILMLRHQLAVAEHGRPKARTRLTWPDRAWLALLAGTVPEAATSERSR